MVKSRLFPFVVILLLAVALRLYGIQSQSIWFDEGWSAYAAQQPSLIAAWQADATNPPLYYVLLNLAARGFGTTEFGLRVFSLFLGLLTIPLTCQLARRAANSRRAGETAALLAALSAPLWWASQEARMYTLLAVLVLVCALAWQRVTTRPTRAAWAALWLGELALLYAHNTGPVVALWLNLVALAAWRIRRRQGGARFDGRLWLAGQAGVGVLWLPYFVTRFLLLQSANSAVTSAPEIGLLLAGQVWLGFWIAPWALAVASLTVLSALALLILPLLLVTLRRPALWLVAHALILTIGLIAGLMALGNDLHGRYLVMIVSLLLAALGVGIARIRDARVRALALAPIALLFALDLIAAQNRDYQHDDARSMVQYYADHLTAADTVIDWSYADRYDLAYYWDRLSVQAKRVTLPEGADLDAVLPLLPAPGGDVALNVWYTQRADYRGMMGCLLGAGTRAAPVSETVYGMTTLVYQRPSLSLPNFSIVDATFRDSGGGAVAHLDAFAQAQPATPDQALCLPLQITLNQALDVDLKAAVLVQNALGWTVASADAVFATANQRTTAGMVAGEALTAYPLLRLPYGAPPGDYAIYLRLYDETVNPSGYQPPAAGAQVSGRDLLLTTWTTLPGAAWAQDAPTGLPNVRNLAVARDLSLVADNLNSDAPLTNGQELRVSLLWRGTGKPPALELADEAGRWSISAPTIVGDHDAVALDWRSLRVPPEAQSGTAILRVGGWATLGRYRIDALPMITEAPAFNHPVHAEFPGVGELVGFTLSDAPFSLDDPPRLKLVWQAGVQAPAVSYTVFAQLIGEDGRVAAQDDSIPGSRATTTWRAGEYVVDDHRLHFNDGAQPGTVRLIVGLYDAATGARVPLADGTDAVTLANNLAVK
jgi:hypothetical protein